MIKTIPEWYPKQKDRYILERATKDALPGTEALRWKSKLLYQALLNDQYIPLKEKIRALGTPVYGLIDDDTFFLSVKSTPYGDSIHKDPVGPHLYEALTVHEKRLPLRLNRYPKESEAYKVVKARLEGTHTPVLVDQTIVDQYDKIDKRMGRLSKVSWMCCEVLKKYVEETHMRKIWEDTPIHLERNHLIEVTINQRKYTYLYKTREVELVGYPEDPCIVDMIPQASTNSIQRVEERYKTVSQWYPVAGKKVKKGGRIIRL